MKSWHLFEAIGLVDDRLVEEAADARRTAAPWGRWFAMAACALLTVSLGIGAGTLLRGCGSGMTATKGAVAPAAASDAAAPVPAPAAAPADPAADAPPADKEEAFDEEIAPEAPAGAPEYAAAEMPEEGSISGNDGGTPELYSETGNLSVSAPETRYGETSGRFARYTVENQSAGTITGTLKFSVDTDENGIEGTLLDIEADGEAIPFTVQETDNVSPEKTGTRRFLVWFDLTVPADGSVEVEIRF